MEQFAEMVKEKFQNVTRRNSMHSLGDRISTNRIFEAESSEITAISLIIIAFGVVCLFLNFLACVLVPFFLAVFLMYLLQPIVNILTKPPRRWLDKCCGKRGETCFESFFRITASRQPNLSFDEMYDASPRAVRMSRRKPYRSNSIEISEVSTPESHTNLVNIMRGRYHTEGDLAYGSLAAEGGIGIRSLSASSFSSEPKPRKRCCWCCSWLDFKMPRWLAVFLTFALVFLLLFFLGYVVYKSILHLQENINDYELGAKQIGGQLNALAEKLNLPLDTFLVDLQNKLKLIVQSLLAEFAKGLGYSFFISIFLAYLLMSPVRPAPNNVWGQIDLHLRRWIRLKTIICVSVGIITALILWMLNVDLALVFGMLAFVFNYVPNIGPTTATLLPVAVAVLNPYLSGTRKILTFVLPTLLHMIVGNFAEPLVMGEQLDLHPVCVLLAMAFWLILWGIPGMLMAVPLVSMMRIVCIHLDHPYSNVIVLLFEGRLLEAYSANPGEQSPEMTPRVSLRGNDYSPSIVPKPLPIPKPSHRVIRSRDSSSSATTPKNGDIERGLGRNPASNLTNV